MVIYMKINLRNRSSLQDKEYKVLFRRMKHKAHNFFNSEKTEEIKFDETEIASTGQKSDIKYWDVTNNKLRLYELISRPLNEEKLLILHDYHNDARLELSNKNIEVMTKIISTANPKHGIIKGPIDYNISFDTHPDFTQEIDGEKILNRLCDKCKKQIELDDDDQVGLLILHDTDIDMPQRDVVKLTDKILLNAKISQQDYDDMVVCHIMSLNRFFTEDEVINMYTTLKAKVADPKAVELLEKYGPGIDTLYIDGKTEGLEEGLVKGESNGTIKVAKKLIAKGCDDIFISECTNLTIHEIKKLKKELKKH